MKTSFRSARSFALITSLGALFLSGCAAGSGPTAEETAVDDQAGVNDFAVARPELHGPTKEESPLLHIDMKRPASKEGTEPEAAKGDRDDVKTVEAGEPEERDNDRRGEGFEKRDHEEADSCDADSDCVIVETKCCDHCNGGEAQAFNAASAKDHEPKDCGGWVVCTRMACSQVVASCQSHHCVAVVETLPDVN